MMMLIGGIIDLFPLAAGAITIYILWTTGAELIPLMIVILLTIITLGIAGYFGKFIEANYCKKCVNLSCMMSKVPESLKQEYLERNPEMLEAWKSCGYEEKDSATVDEDTG